MDRVKIFFSDLDNTLIYSHRHDIPLPKIIVEFLNGKAQSFITKSSFDYIKSFCTHEDSLFVPLTTRSKEQYDRIDFLNSVLKLKYSLICNGAILLKNGEPCDEWKDESIRLAGKQLDTLYHISKIVNESVESDHIHYIEPFMLYLKGKVPEKLLPHFIREDIDVLYGSGKQFFIPRAFKKGNAILRFKDKYYPDAVTYAAGDSEFDVSMFQVSNYSFIPDRQFIKYGKELDIMLHGDFISDELLYNLSRIILSD